MSLRKVLDAAEQVLATGGLAEFTVATVADRAGVSVGAIYRRFAGKEQLLHAVKDELLGRLETGVAEALRGAESGVDGVLGAFAHALAGTFAGHDRVFPELLGGQRADAVERGLRTLATVQDALADALEPYRDEIRRAEPDRAIRVAARTITGSCVHRAATCRSWPDGLTWPGWADEVAAMAGAYLGTSGGHGFRGAGSPSRSGDDQREGR